RLVSVSPPRSFLPPPWHSKHAVTRIGRTFFSKYSIAAGDGASAGTASAVNSSNAVIGTIGWPRRRAERGARFRRTSPHRWDRLKPAESVVAADVQQAVRHQRRRPGGVLQERLAILASQLHRRHLLVLLRVHLYQAQHTVLVEDDEVPVDEEQRGAWHAGH